MGDLPAHMPVCYIGKLAGCISQGFSVSPSLGLGLQAHITVPSFSPGCAGLNSVSHAFMGGTLPIKPCLPVPLKLFPGCAHISLITISSHLRLRLGSLAETIFLLSSYRSISILPWSYKEWPIWSTSQASFELRAYAHSWLYVLGDGALSWNLTHVCTLRFWCAN